MKKEDLIFLANNLSTLCRIPIRIYKDKEQIHFFNSTSLIKDPFIVEEEKLLNKTEEIGYIINDEFFYYTYIKHLDYKIILGPFRQLKPNDIVITKIASKLKLNKDELDNFIETIKSIPTSSLENFLHILCLVHFSINKKKVNVSDILIDKEQSQIINTNINQEIKNNEINEIVNSSINNSFTIEQELYRIVEHGEIDELKLWLNNAPIIHSGVLSNDTIRHTKNTFIAAATLISRAAIKGQMDPGKALALSDMYIQKMESLNNSLDIYTLQMNMVLEFTEQVAKIHGKKDASSLLINFNKYILSHLTDSIKIKDICKSLYVSKSVLFDKIKQETNMTVSNYILKIKINESKSLLKYTDKSISSISSYLGFSSQSHFNHTFKKLTNKTPNEYRKKHK